MKIKKITAGLLAALTLLCATGCDAAERSSEKSEKTSKSESASGGAASVNPEAAMPEKDFVSSTDGSARVTVDGTKFMVGDKEIWFNGVNAPWDKWNDFGGGFNFEYWNDHFSELHESGVNAARIWICCNGDVGMLISPDGTFEGATTAHWEDLDDLMLLAEQYHIYIMATVQSFDHYKDANNNYKAWRTLIQDEEKVDQYVDNYIVPLVKRYDSSDYFWSVDLCNEPDWVVENDECGKLEWVYLQSYYAKACAAIHENSDVLVTVGMGMIKYNSDAHNGNKISDKELQSFVAEDSGYDSSLAYVDFYSTHWYSWMKPNWGIIYEKTPTDFGLDGTKPAVIGEMPAVSADAEYYNVTDAYEKAYNNGYNGVFAWKSSGSDDGCGLWTDIQPAIEKMMSICSDKIFPLNDK